MTSRRRSLILLLAFAIGFASLFGWRFRRSDERSPATDATVPAPAHVDLKDIEALFTGLGIAFPANVSSANVVLDWDKHFPSAWILLSLPPGTSRVYVERLGLTQGEPHVVLPDIPVKINWWNPLPVQSGDFVARTRLSADSELHVLARFDHDRMYVCLSGKRAQFPPSLVTSLEKGEVDSDSRMPSQGGRLSVGVWP